MKVKDLIAALGAQDPEAHVLCYTEDEGLLPPKHMFRLIEIESIGVVEGEKCRGDDQIATLKFGGGQNSEKHVVINLLTDF